MELTQILISAVAGLISGTLASLVAPWVNWGIERHRIRFNSRQALIQEARSALKLSDYKRDVFRDTVEYSRLRPFLRQNVTSTIEGDNPVFEELLEPLRNLTGNEDHVKYLILNEISELEKKWKLI